MKFFKHDKSTKTTGNQSDLAMIVLNAIHDGVIMTDKTGVVQFINPAAISMTECGSANNATGLDYGLIVKLESKEGRQLSDNENPLIQSINTGKTLDSCQLMLISKNSGKRIPVAVSVLMVEGIGQNRIILFRNIAKELEEEGEQTEFISTASHEMRTPVATIDGYLCLALNPQTATIDERARGYLAAAEKASKHLGKLFQDLLDVTKLDDGKIRPHFEPVEMVSVMERLSKDYIVRAKDAKLTFNFGSDEPLSFDGNKRINQVVYGYVDLNFLREIIDNLIDNAIKYTPEGGSIYVNVRGDGDRILINVTDTGIGISSEDLGHVFQKFYRADNSDTRTIGGNGLGLYLVKQRTEAMGGRVWAESAFGEGTTFYVSLPRLTHDEYEKRMIAVQNQQMIAQQSRPAPVQPPINPVMIQNQQPSMTPSIPSIPNQPTINTNQTIQPQPPPSPQVATGMSLINQSVQNQINNNLNGENK